MKSLAIEINNNKAQFYGGIKELNQLYNEFRIRHPQAFHMRQYMPRGWDGKIDLMSKNGSIDLGLLPKALGLLDNWGIGYEIDDHRPPLGVEPELITNFNGITLRDYQEGSLSALLNNRLVDSTGDEIPFYRGMLKEATNAGKTLITAAIFLSFQKIPTLVLIQGSDLYDQALEELPKYVGEEYVGRIDPKKVELAPLTIAKVKTLANRVDKLKRDLLQYRIGIVDECDLADNKTYKRPLTHLINLSVMVGVSGTAQMGKLVKHKPKHFSIEGRFGPIIHETTNRELIDKGHSTEVIVKLIKGNEKVYPGLSFTEEYEECIVFNEQRNNKIIKRLRYNCIKKKRVPALIICQRIDHVELLYKKIKKAFKGELKVGFAVAKKKLMSDKERKKAINDFKNGDIDVLITSMIINRGMNLHKMQYLLNAAGGESPERPLQILGRLFRKLEGVKYKYYEDFYDEGNYIRKHSKRRRNYYEDEDIVVLPLF